MQRIPVLFFRDRVGASSHNAAGLSVCVDVVGLGDENSLVVGWLAFQLIFSLP